MKIHVKTVHRSVSFPKPKGLPTKSAGILNHSPRRHTSEESGKVKANSNFSPVGKINKKAHQEDMGKI